MMLIITMRSTCMEGHTLLWDCEPKVKSRLTKICTTESCSDWWSRGDIFWVFWIDTYFYTRLYINISEYISMTVKKLLNGNWFIQVFVIGQDPAALRLSDLTKRCCNSSTRCHCKKKTNIHITTEWKGMYRIFHIIVYRL